MKTVEPGRTSSAGRAGLTRRDALAALAALAAPAAAAGVAIVPRSVLGGPNHVAPSGRIAMAAIGVGGQGVQNIANFIQSPEVQFVAVCDPNRDGSDYQSANWDLGKQRRSCGREPARRMVDEHYAQGKSSGQYKACRAYADYRELLAREDVDAVMIATPDHTHAVITMAAIARKKHVYCEKPLTYSVYEARQVTMAARRAGVATQLGNQGQSFEDARITREIIDSGAIGHVREVQLWSPARFWEYPSWEGRPKEKPPVPAGLDWDLWIGPAPMRPYHPAYCPWTWRNWWDFGTGLLGDLWCHKVSTVFKALRLGYPTSVEASCTRNDGEIYPLGVIARYEFPARGELPPVTLTWYDGGLKPPQPLELEPGRQMSDVIYVGEKGKMMNHRLIPESRMKTLGRLPKTLPRSPGHYKEFVAACLGGQPAGSNFVDHGGVLSEVCMLGNVALRAEKKIAWDGPNFRITNDQAANKLLHRNYRAGWTLEGEVKLA